MCIERFSPDTCFGVTKVFRDTNAVVPSVTNFHHRLWRILNTSMQQRSKLRFPAPLVLRMVRMFECL